LVPYIRDNQDLFEGALTRLLKAKDKRGPSRLVFYAVVQVGGFVALDSDLGIASKAILGAGFPISTPKEGMQAYFAGDLYFWWLESRDQYESFPLFDEWNQREFAQTVAVPMYNVACNRK
jgi:hypothetical protein